MKTTDTRTPRKDAKTCLGIIAALLLPSVLALATVDVPRPLEPIADNPTPYGYTISLAFFIVPIVVLGFWFMRHPKLAVARNVFWITIAILAPLGLGLDFLFATQFFTFPNKEATLGIALPVRGGTVPIEEMVFYFTGFLATLLIYIWCNEYWCDAYKVSDHAGEAQTHGVHRVLDFHVGPLLVAAIVLVPAFVYEEFVTDDPAGFPGYLTFLVLASVLPSIVLYKTVCIFINWRAFSLTFFVLLLLSLQWEATLALPYQWWGFKEDQMIGLFISAWSRLPVEETLVWMAVSYTTVLVYETVALVVGLGLPVRFSLFGNKTSGLATPHNDQDPLPTKG